MISNVLSLCHTNLTSNEMLSIAYWAMTKQPTFESLSLPTRRAIRTAATWAMATAGYTATT